jgi:hypothetical protein
MALLSSGTTFRCARMTWPFSGVTFRWPGVTVPRPGDDVAVLRDDIYGFGMTRQGGIGSRSALNEVASGFELLCVR